MKLVLFLERWRYLGNMMANYTDQYGLCLPPLNYPHIKPITSTKMKDVTVSVLDTEVDGELNTQLLMVQDSNVIGMVTMSWRWPGQPVLMNLFIKKGHRKSGLARILINKCEEVTKAKNIGCIYLSVAPTNTIGEAYLKYGFEYTSKFTEHGSKWMKKEL